MSHIEGCTIFGLDDLCQKKWLQHAIRAKTHPIINGIVQSSKAPRPQNQKVTFQSAKNTPNGIVQSSKAPKPQNQKVTFQSATYIYHITLNLKNSQYQMEADFSHTSRSNVAVLCMKSHTVFERPCNELAST